MVTLPNTEFGEAFKILCTHTINFSDLKKKLFCLLRASSSIVFKLLSVVLRFNSHNRTH